jgi:Protein of unknown function (DUF3089)
MRTSFYLILLVFSLISCKTYKPNYTYLDQKTNPIDYTLISNWAAHPNIMDESDRTPEGDTVSYEGLMADVFFLHPTTYTGDKNQDKWNASIDDQELNTKTDEGTIRFQASAFNHAGKVYAPRYRQAHLHAYFTNDKLSAKKAFEVAYADVKNAFEYYLNNLNHGRPIIIASHSQGTNHAERLLADFFDNKPLKQKLVAAYLIGMPVKNNKFKEIIPCENGDETGCFVSWRTFKKGHQLPTEYTLDSICVTNPLSWQCNDDYVDKTQNKGTLLFEFDKVYENHIDAQVYKDILWANKPKFRGSIFLRTKNYHPADINFYYMNIRENSVNRVNSYVKKINEK